MAAAPVEFRVPFIHSLAMVTTSEVGARSKVWQFASVVRGARLGADCSVGSCATIDGAWLGDRCLVSHGAFLPPGVRCGDDVFVGPGAVLCNDAWPRVDKAGFDIAAMLAGKQVTVLVEDGASIGANATILPGVTIGKGAMVAAGAVVGSDVPPECLWRRDGHIEALELPLSRRRVREVKCSTL